MAIITRLITKTIGQLVLPLLSSKQVRMAVARMAFSLLHKIAAKTPYTFDEDLVGMLEDAYWDRLPEDSKAKAKEAAQNAPTVRKKRLHSELDVRHKS